MPALNPVHVFQNYNVTLKPLNICVTKMRQNADVHNFKPKTVF